MSNSGNKKSAKQIMEEKQAEMEAELARLQAAVQQEEEEERKRLEAEKQKAIEETRQRLLERARLQKEKAHEAAMVSPFVYIGDYSLSGLCRQLKDLALRVCRRSPAVLARRKNVSASGRRQRPTPG